MRRLLIILLLCTASIGSVIAQPILASGKVTDSSGNPVVGATISILGSKKATTSDSDGRFSIQTENKQTIRVSAVGYEEIDVKPALVMQLQLKSITTALSEVVITAFGIRREKKAVGYAVTTVDPDNILQKSEPDLLKNLQGKVPGVDIRASHGSPGAATRIQIRGNSSFGLETQPLIVVDGIPYSNDQLTTSNPTVGGSAYGSGLANLDPNDIESINILKGAASAALYGSRASRGAVIITTKSGSAKKGKKPLNISLKTSVSAEQISNLPAYQNLYGSGANFDPRTGSNGSWGAKFGLGNVYDANGNVLRKSSSGVDSINAWGTYLAAYPELFDANGNAAYKPYPNNVRDGFRTGILFENSIAVNGGEGNTSIAFTASNVSHKGYVINSSYTRNNIGVGAQTKWGNFSIGGNLSYSTSKQVGGFFGNNQTAGASSQFARSLHMARNWDMFGLPYQDKAGKPLAFVAGGYDHPTWAAYHNVSTTKEERVVAGMRLGYKVNTWLNFTYNIGVNTNSIGRDEVTDEFSRAASGLGRIVNDNLRGFELQSTLIAVFTPKISNNVSLDFKIGNDINQRSSRRIANTGSDFIVPGLYSLTNTVEKTFNRDSRFKRRMVGIFADATFGYKNFAFLNVSGRNDRTSTLPYKNASYYYPAVSGSFIFTDALNLKSEILNYGKLRIGWAKVGNDAPENQGEDVYTLSGTNYLGLPYASLSGLPFSGVTVDPDLTPEFTQELEAGIELTALNKRLNFDFTWYKKITTDLIYPVSVPVSTGYTSFNTNIGEISNKGVEISLAIKPIVTNHLLWEIRGVFTKNKNVVEKLVPGLERTNLGGGFAGGISAWLEPGKPFGYLRGQVADRTEDGKLLIDPQTGWIIESLTQDYVGDPNPDFTLGVNNSVNYKNLSLSFLFDYKKGGDFYSNTISNLLGRGVTLDTKDREALWVIPGVYGDPNTHLPVLVNGNTVTNQTRISTNDLYFAGTAGQGSFAINSADEFSVYDGTTFRLREISLGYSLPKKLFVKNKFISEVNISLTAHNLWFYAPNVPKYTRYDPEVNSYGSSIIQGIELETAPTTKRFGFNINVTF